MYPASAVNPGQEQRVILTETRRKRGAGPHIKLGRRKPGGRPGETGHRIAGRCEGAPGLPNTLRIRYGPGMRLPGPAARGLAALSAEADACACRESHPRL